MAALGIIRVRRVYTNTLLAQQVHKQRAGLVIPVREHSLLLLVLLHALDVLVEEVGRVEGSTLRLRVELGAENRAGVVDKTLVGLVVQVGEVLPPVSREGGGIDGITVVLGSDVALSGGKVKRRDVVRTVAILELDGLSTGSEGEQLVTHANAHHRNLGGLEQPAEVVHGRGAVSRVTRAVGDENAIEVVGDLVNRVVEGERCNAGAPGDKAAENVLLHTAVDQGDVQVTERRAHVERSLRANTANKVDGLGVNVGLVLVGIILLADGDASQRRTLLTEVGDDLTGVHTGNGDRKSVV